MTRQVRFAAVASHAIPYYAPYYRALTKHSGMRIRTFLASRIGLDKTFDPGMGLEISWKTDLLAGYDHVLLPEASTITDTGFRDVDNPSVVGALADFSPDVVLLHGYSQVTMLRALAWCRRNAVPALMISDSSLHTGTSFHARLLKRAALPALFSQFTAFLSIGDANQKYLESYGVARRRIFRVPNMVDEGFWARRSLKQQERARLRSELGIRDDDLVVLYVGKLIERKRPGDLLAALSALRSMNSRRNVRVLFAGNGAQRAELESRATREKLPAHFLGFVNIDALPSYYCAADVLAHPAEVETFGVIVLEAAILGLPLVLSDRVGAIGPSSIARPGLNAITYRCGDINALASAIARLADEPELLVRMSAASIEVSEELDWRMSVRNTLAAVDFCLSNEHSISKHAGGPRNAA